MLAQPAEWGEQNHTHTLGATEMDAKLIVTLELKEVQDAVIEAARTKIGDSKGSSAIEFLYEAKGDDGVSGAKVSFQYTKH